MAQLDLLNDTVLAADFAAAPLSVSEPAHKAASAKEKSPDAMRTISEVAAELGEETHVLRFWETRFPQVQPVKMKGGRRHYKPADVLMLRTIRTLLHERGYTIKGAQALLAAHKNPLDALNAPAMDEAPEPMIVPVQEVVGALKAATEKYDAQAQAKLQSALVELKEMRAILCSSERGAAR